MLLQPLVHGRRCSGPDGHSIRKRLLLLHSRKRHLRSDHRHIIASHRLGGITGAFPAGGTGVYWCHCHPSTPLADQAAVVAKWRTPYFGRWTPSDLPVRHDIPDLINRAATGRFAPGCSLNNSRTGVLLPVHYSVGNPDRLYFRVVVFANPFIN